MDGNNMEAGRDKFVRYRESIREYSEQGSEISRSPSDLEDLLGDDPSLGRRLVDTRDVSNTCTGSSIYRIYARVGFLVPTCYYAHLRTRTATPTLTRERCH